MAQRLSTLPGAIMQSPTTPSMMRSNNHTSIIYQLSGSLHHNLPLQPKMVDTQYMSNEWERRATIENHIYNIPVIKKTNT
jgi:hypothetical protein